LFHRAGSGGLTGFQTNCEVIEKGWKKMCRCWDVGKRSQRHSLIRALVYQGV